MSIQAHIEDLRTQRAAEWLEILRGPHPERHAEFMRWVTESSLNLDEFLKLEALTRETRAVLQSSDLDLGALLKHIDPKVFPIPLRAESRKITLGGHHRRVRIGSLAAALAVVTLVGFWAYRQFFAWTEYAASAEQQTIELADGSRVYLNARSTLAVRLGSTGRNLRLARGEALFDVAQDHERPFRVWTHDAVIEALGTQFNVNAREDGTQVAVIEGKVRITRDEAGSSPTSPDSTTALEAGQAARVTPRGTIQRDSGIDVRKAVSWSRPQLIFEGTSLEEAVAQFNRQHRSRRLRMEGVPAGSHHYSGIFNATDVETFATLLAREPDLEVIVREDEIVLRGR